MLKSELKRIVSTSLPGEKAHLPMMPISRPLSSVAREKAISFKESSVSVILTEIDKQIEVILIQRRVYDGPHSGQISFPGGKRDLADENLYDTAVRECFEEIGLKLELDHFIGKLTPVFIPVSNFHVDVNLFYYSSELNFLKNEREVESILSFDIEEILNEDNIKIRDININESYTLKDVPYFELNNEIVWGATALILSELKEVLKQINSLYFQSEGH